MVTLFSSVINSDKVYVMEKRIWIAWETQRRSVVLSKELNCDLHIFDYSGWLRYPKCFYHTFFLIFKNRPDILFVQNPSRFLAAFACFLKILFNVTVIVDRHSTFRIGKQYKNKFDTNLFYKYLDKIFNKYTVSRADLTIVTNDFLGDIVLDLGGTPFVLPDKIPELSPSNKLELKGDHNIFLISSFSADEPFLEIFSAMEMLSSKNINLYISGNSTKLDKSILNLKPSNVILTGFLDDQEFVNMVYSVDAIMALTTSDHTMLCSCYEAYAASQPLITSKKDVLIDYFVGARFVENVADDIAAGIVDVLSNNDAYKDKIVKSKHDIICSWNAKLSELEGIL